MHPERILKKFGHLRGCHQFLAEVLQWLSGRKYILKHTQTTNKFDTKIIPHDYILY